ncbi:MAG: autotransporter-associated beta strand repeat-containing protein [Opitutaceae bacterium]
MKTPFHRPTSTIHLAKTAFAAGLLLATGHHAQAANGTWTNDGADNLWQNSINWGGALPGSTSGFANANVATFGASGSGTVDLGGTINLTRIFFGINGGNAGAFTIGDSGDTLNLTSTTATSIGVTGGVSANETIGAAINLSTATNAAAGFINNGTGLLTIGGAVTSNEASGTTTLTVGGAGNGLLSGVVSGSGAGGNSGLKLNKIGSGTWTLSGANTFTGATTIFGGTLALDYGTHIPLDTTDAVVLVGGGATFKGKSTGTTTATIGSLAWNQSSTNLTANTLTLDSNGGSGVNLTISTLTQSQTSAVSQLIDLSSNAGNSVTVTTLDTTKFALQNGVLETVVTAGSQYRANTILKDSTGYGFATISGSTNATLGRLQAFEALTDVVTSDSVNYRLAGSLTHTVNDLRFNTLTIDSSAGAITLDMGAKNISPSVNSSGRGILVTGSNNVQINGSGNFGTLGTYVFNYSTGDLSIQLGSSATFLIGGTGFTNLSGIFTMPTSAQFDVAGGIARLSTAQTFPATGAIQVTGGGVLEIGADLNGAAAGDFTNAVGTSTNTGQIRFTGDSGLSASGANRVVNFGGASAQLTWGANGFLQSAATLVTGLSDGGYTLLLSSAKSDATLEIQNPIALGNGAGGNVDRVVSVANGSASTDAILSGVLSGPGANLIKTGAGTLSLDGVNTYTGGTIISAGKLALGSTGSLASTTYSIGNGATFDVSAKSSYSLALVAVTIDAGSAGAGFFKGPTGALALGNAALTINFSTSMLTNGQTYNLFDYGSQTGDFSSVALSGSITGSFVLTSTDTWTGSFDGYDFTFSEVTGILSLAAVPEPATCALLGGLGILFFAFAQRRRRAFRAA